MENNLILTAFNEIGDKIWYPFYVYKDGTYGKPSAVGKIPAMQVTAPFSAERLVLKPQAAVINPAYCPCFAHDVFNGDLANVPPGTVLVKPKNAKARLENPYCLKAMPKDSLFLGRLLYKTSEPLIGKRAVFMAKSLSGIAVINAQDWLSRMPESITGDYGCENTAQLFKMLETKTMMQGQGVGGLADWILANNCFIPSLSELAKIMELPANRAFFASQNMFGCYLSSNYAAALGEGMKYIRLNKKDGWITAASKPYNKFNVLICFWI